MFALNGDCALVLTNGKTCEFGSKCFGISSQSSLVCNGRGICVNKNVCLCEENNLGENCDIPICDQRPATDELVCSGHGQCVAANSCQCNDGFTGQNCETPICYSITANSSLVCSGHGRCISNNTCVCNYSDTSGYYGGTNCSRCADGYSGELCVDQFCNPVTVCHNRGTCFKNSCSCFFDDIQGHYSGENCLFCAKNYYGPNCTTFCDALTSCSSRGICDEGSGQCSCFKSEKDGYFEGNNCAQCSSGYDGQDCTVLIPSNTFMFNSAGDAIIGTFKTNRYFSCLELFEAEDDLEHLGNDFTCNTYGNNGTLSIRLGIGASLRPGHTLEMKYLKHEGNAKVVKTIQVLANPSPIAPIPVINAPDDVYDCEAITISGVRSRSADGRPLTYSWKIEPYMEVLTQNGIPTDVPHFIIDAASTVRPGTYQLQLTVTSLLGVSVSVTKSMIKHATSFPTISLSPYMNIYTRRELTKLKLVGFASYPRSCNSTSSVSSTFGFRWSQVSGPTTLFDSVEGNTLPSLKSQALKDGQYTLKFTTYSKLDNRINDQFVDFLVEAAPVSISLGDDITTQSNARLTLSLLINDPDAEVSSEKPIILYECRTLNGAMCPAVAKDALQAANSQNPPTVTSVTFLLSDNNKMPLGSYIITARYKRDGKVATTSKKITFVDRIDVIVTVGVSSALSQYEPITFTVCEIYRGAIFPVASRVWYLNDKLYTGPQKHVLISDRLDNFCYTVDLVSIEYGTQKFTVLVTLHSGQVVSGSKTLTIVEKPAYVVETQTWRTSTPYFQVRAFLTRPTDNIKYFTCYFDFDGCPSSRCRLTQQSLKGDCGTNSAPYGNGNVTIVGEGPYGIMRSYARFRFLRIMNNQEEAVSTTLNNDDDKYISKFMLRELEDYAMTYATFNEFASTLQDSVAIFHMEMQTMKNSNKRRQPNSTMIIKEKKIHIVETYMKTITQIHVAANFSDDLPNHHVSMMAHLISKVVHLGDNFDDDTRATIDDIPYEVYDNATSITKSLLSDAVRLNLALDSITGHAISSVLKKGAEMTVYSEFKSDSKKVMFMIARLSPIVQLMTFTSGTSVAGLKFTMGLPLIQIDFGSTGTKKNNPCSVQIHNTIKDPTESRVIVSHRFGDLPLEYENGSTNFNISGDSVVSVSVLSSDGQSELNSKFNLIYHLSVNEAVQSISAHLIPYCIYYDDMYDEETGIWKNDTKCSTTTISSSTAITVTCSCKYVKTVAVAYVLNATHTSPELPPFVCPVDGNKTISGRNRRVNVFVGLSVGLGLSGILILLLIVVIVVLLATKNKQNNKFVTNKQDNKAVEMKEIANGPDTISVEYYE